MVKGKKVSQTMELVSFVKSWGTNFGIDPSTRVEDRSRSDEEGLSSVIASVSRLSLARGLNIRKFNSIINFLNLLPEDLNTNFYQKGALSVKSHEYLKKLSDEISFGLEDPDKFFNNRNTMEIEHVLALKTLNDLLYVYCIDKSFFERLHLTYADVTGKCVNVLNYKSNYLADRVSELLTMMEKEAFFFKSPSKKGIKTGN